MAAGATPEEISEAEADRLFARCFTGAGAPSSVTLAVSGGVDSMVLLHLAALAARRHRYQRLSVATVDHGLRAESAAEARFVAIEAERRGLPHRTLLWSGPKPATGLQAAAREARYRLLAEACRSAGGGWLVTAHTADDQAETIIMRLARGSGVDGLAGMLEFERWVSDAADPSRQAIIIHRPLLGVGKERLIATAKAQGVPWCEDPSNRDGRFERVRIRQAMPALAELGLTTDALVRSARRLADARQALAHAAALALADPSRVRFEPIGYAVLDRRVWRDPKDRLPAAVLVRVLAALVRQIGGAQRHLSLAALEDVVSQMSAAFAPGSSEPFATTIGQTLVRRSGEEIHIIREIGRNPPADVRLPPGGRALWDGRFQVELVQDAPSSLDVRPLGTSGRVRLKAEGRLPPGLPNEALEAMPAFWDRDLLVAAPALANHWRRSLSPQAEAQASLLEGMARVRLEVAASGDPANGHFGDLMLL